MSTAWLVLTGGATFALVALAGAVAPRLLRSSSAAAVLVVVAASAALGILAPGAPTRIAVLDAVLRGVFGATCALASAWVPSRPRLAAAIVVAVPPFLADGGGAFAMVALGLAAAAVVLSVDAALIGAVIGLAVGQAALRLGWPLSSGLTAAVAAVALLVLAVPALTSVPERSRRVLLVPLLVLGTAVVVVLTLYGFTILLTRDDVNAGIDSANAGLVAAREGRTREAARLFAQAQDRFEHANDMLEAWWTKPVLAVPLASQQARALSRMSAIGVDLAGSGTRTSRAADPDATRLVDGAVPLAAIEELETPLTEALTSLRRAARRLEDIDGTWLVAPLGNRLSNLRADVTRARHDARTGVMAARVVPRLLGKDGQSQRYFVAFQNPAEQRASGGIIGNFAVIDFTDGRLQKVRSGRDGDLNTEGARVRTLTGPEDYLERYSHFEPQYVWQNVTMSPDWPSVSEVIGGLYPQSGGEPVDGAISIDPIALGAFLELTGPVTVTGLDEPLTADNAARILLRDQYTEFPDLQERVDFLESAVDAVIDRLQTGAFADAARIGEVLGPMVRQGRVKVHTADPAGAEFFDRVQARGELPEVRGDFAGLVTQNASGNKIELFLHRALDYAVEIDEPTRTARAVATITLRNDAPTSGLPDSVIAGSGTDPTPPGHYRGYVTFYTPLALQRATVDGQAVAVDTARELDRNALSMFVDVPSGESATIQLDLAGPVRLPRSGNDRCYDLTVWHQPTIEPDRLTVRVAGAEGTALGQPRGLRAGDDGFTLKTRPQTDENLSVCLS